MKLLYRIAFFLFISNSLLAQVHTVYSRVEIPLKDNYLEKAKALGIDLDHGYRTTQNNYVAEISQAGIEVLRKNNIPYKVTIPDLTTYYVNRSKNNQIQNRDLNPCFPDPVIDTPAHFKLGSMIGFYTYEEFLNELDSMRILYPDLITQYAPISNFQTYDNNPIYWLKISDNPDVSESEPQVLYTALHHAREPMSLTSLIFYMWHMLENYGKDDEITALINSSELYFIPMINPDGYQLNQMTDPQGGGMWRKNVTPNSASNFGTDLNRNYSKFWAYDDLGSSPYGDADTYRGPSAFSEIETQAVKYFCESHAFDIALNYHSYGNLVIFPWGFDGSECPDNESFENVADQFISHNKFTGGTTTQSVGYLTNGCSDDWMYGDETAHNSMLSFTPEIGNEFDGFWPIESRIIPLANSALEMNIDALRYLHNFIKPEFIGLPALSASDNSIQININQLGKRPEYTNIIVSEKNNKMLFSNPVASALLSSNEELLLDFPFTWNDVKSGDSLVIYITVSDNLIDRIDTIELEYYDIKEVLFQDNCNSLKNWIAAGTWGLSAKDFTSPGASFSDSPSGNYMSNTVGGISSKDDFFVQDKFVKTYLSYNAKWSFERFYDYATVYALTPIDSTIVYLCSKNSRQGSTYQIENQPVYESNSIKWKREVVDIGFLNAKAFNLNFVTDVDGFDERDGIYIDDMAITAFRHISTKQDDIEETHINIYPNPSSDILNIISNAPIKYVTISDLFGRRLIETKGDLNLKMAISLSDQLLPGYYSIEIQSESGKVKTSRFILSN